jgi:hypothetical protein
MASQSQYEGPEDRLSDSDAKSAARALRLNNQPFTATYFEDVASDGFKPKLDAVDVLFAREAVATQFEEYEGLKARLEDSLTVA